ncbi:MAG: LysR family transcriptional regulator [Oscillibacter sp.]|jgi:DNA-binding transcriptional LysR family regulator|nr:LysR family transcriptional regulator [Oscillibacter sp.]
MLEISLKQLETFVATAEYNSFTRAGEELYLTQSTVSAHIRSLEQVLGTLLIQRGSRKRIALTEEGKRVYGEAKEILSRCQTLQDMTENTHSRELTIGASTVPAQYLLPALMSGFMRRYSDSRYLLKRGDSMGIHQLLEQGEVRIGFVGTALDRQNYAYHTLTEDRLVLITADTERFRTLKAQGKYGRDLLGEPMILREESSGTRRAMEAYLKHNHIPRDSLLSVACMDNPEAIKNSVSQGMGVSVVSYLAVQEELDAGKLLAFDLDPEGAYRKIYVTFRKETVLTEIEQRFISYIRAEMRSNHR